MLGVVPAKLVVGVTVLVAAVSLVVSVLVVLLDGDGRGPVLPVIEAAVIVVLIFVAVRRTSSWPALGAGLLAVVAGTVMIVVESRAAGSIHEAPGGVAFWLLFALGAAGAALYLDALDVRRARSIADARRSQRLELARDLHDFVAHDVSAIVVRAQAGRVAAKHAPEQALAALQRIEEDGLRALATMDRTVQALHDVTGAAGRDLDAQRPRRHGLDDLAELTQRFRTAGPSEVHLELGRDVVRDLPPDVSTTGYRVAVEALTNVRRHAPGATRVEVVAARLRAGSGPALALTVTNDGVARHDSHGRALPPGGRDGGLGLAGLRERVEALGGTVTAGPRHHGSWQVRAVLPLPEGGGGSP